MNEFFRRNILMASTGGGGLPPNNEIWYTSTNGRIATPFSPSGFDANIVSNTYVDGKGVVRFDAAITQAGTDAKWIYHQNQVLSSIILPNSVISIGMYAFNDTPLSVVTLPNSIISIGQYAFAKCKHLTTIKIPDSVTEIKGGAFRASGLVSLELPINIGIISSDLCHKCLNLQYVIIPDSVVRINGYAFDGCSNLESVTIKAIAPPVLENTTVFRDNKPGRKIYVPAASVNAYKTAANWSTYAADIEAISQ